MKKLVANELFFEEVERMLAEGKEVRFTLKGHSMYPFLRNNKEEVVVKACNPTLLKRQDVVLFRYQGRHILHRIVHLDAAGFTMQGDGICQGMEHCEAKDIAGKVTRIRYASGKWVDADNVSLLRANRIWLKMKGIRRILLRLFRFFW